MEFGNYGHLSVRHGVMKHGIKSHYGKCPAVKQFWFLARTRVCVCVCVLKCKVFEFIAFSPLWSLIAVLQRVQKAASVSQQRPGSCMFKIHLICFVNAAVRRLVGIIHGLCYVAAGYLAYFLEPECV